MSLSNLVERNKIETILNLSKSGYIVILLLNETNKYQEALIEEISRFGIFMSEVFDGNHLKEYKDRIQKIYDLARIIIRQEEKKL